MADQERAPRIYTRSPLAEYRTLVLRDRSSLRHPLSSTDNSEAINDFLVGGPAGVVLQSAGNYFFPLVQVEVFDEEPDPDPGEWEVVAETVFDAPGGTISVESVTAVTHKEDVPLGPPGDYRVRAHCRGREAIRQLEQAPDEPEEEEMDGVEQWLLQIWPAR